MSPIFSSPSLNSTSSILFPKKDPTPITFKLFGNLTDVKFFLANACFPISKTGCPSISSGITKSVSVPVYPVITPSENSKSDS